jgi:hypothetical protein
MEIVVTVFATVVAAGCFFAILSNDRKEAKSNNESSTETEKNQD